MVVLVINETAVFREIVRRFFEMRGYAVLEAATSSESYLQAMEYKPQVVLVDNLMESLSCLTICKNIQSIPGMETAKFVIFTDFEGEVEDASGINLKETITKPNIVPKLKKAFPALK
ncbi:MAG: response regulator [Chloroflexi bacterium]|uniref:Response regulator n=1 Tax=Candidatus Chlorohelix allophototropha TaxID=3003348 RepID=A0A8T7M9W6_9CHLR|nr:response regulator [Chloroflexota bacterium]WJW68850.1 response regulator [Chloroflexota bacterium L227-S17]